MSVVTAAVEPNESVQEHGVQEDQPTLVMLDPHQVEPEENIRWNVRLNKGFVASVRQFGVLQPVLARVDAEGHHLVRDGKRRLMAAREAGRKLPAFVVDAKDEKTARILEQYVTNFHRDGLTTAEKAAAWQQLSLEGMSPTAIARKTGTRREVIESGLIVVKHETANQAVADYDITLEQAAVLIQLEDDPEAVEQLREVAKNDRAGFDHTAQKLLDAKSTRDEIARVRGEYEAQGIAVVVGSPERDQDVAFLRDLRTAEGEPVTEENYAGKPGYAMAVWSDWSGVVSRPVVVGWKGHGLLRTVGGRGAGGGGPMTDEEKVARREVVANNKAWASAEKVRRTWVRALLGRKKLPADAQAFATSVLVQEIFAVERAVKQGHPTGAALLGAESGRARDHLAKIIEDSPAKTGHVLLAVALGALEASVDRSTWRYPTGTARRYLSQLAPWGYVLSDVEQLVISESPSDGDDTSGATAAQA